MNTIKIFLAESGRIADLKKDFPLYQGQYQNKLLNVYVPTSILAPNFSVQESGTTVADYVSSTAVKIGMRTIERNGKINTSKTYYMRYLKTLTYQNVEYALYERKLPQEFTFYAGQGENAPVLIANVVNVNNETTPATIIEITPSQTCSLDVMPSGYLDTDEPIEATALEEINSRLNAIDKDLAKKQNIQDDTLETTAKTIVGAINENKGRIDTNTQDIETNRQNIATNRNDIDFLMQNMQMSEDYIGQLRGTTLPNNSQLTQFVKDNTDPSREPKNGDVIIFILEVDGGTDKNYKYFYTATEWQGYEIPPLETASNGSLGIMKGTYGIANYETLVDVSGGEILNIYVKDNTNTYRNIREYLNTTTTNIADIVSGNTSVGVALRAVADGLGNNIVNTYLTQTLGATKQYVRDYAMPREFNDVYFIATAGYLEQVPTTPESGIQFTTTTNAVADFQLFQIQKTNIADFELSSKNGYSNNIYISASVNCRVAFRLTTQYKKPGQDWADLNVELTSPINLTAGDIEKIMFGNPFTSLEENVISLTDGDLIRQTLEVISQTSETITFNVYSNSIYPSTFNLTSQSYVLSDVEQSVSRLILLGMDGVIEANRVVFEVQNPDSFVEYRTNQREFLINGHLPIVGELDDTLSVYITFGEKTYGVFSYMKGSSTPITIGDLKSNMIYNQSTGYSFTSKMIFLETSDYVGFVISPATITAEQLINIIEDTETIVLSLDNNKTKLNIQLSNDVITKLARTLTTPLSTPSSTELVGVDSNNSQQMIELGNGLVLSNDVLSIQLNDTLAPYISYAVSQSLTDEQKALARANIGAGASGFSGSYPDLNQKPILNTSNTTSQTAQADETIDGTINLHKVSKTGALADAIQDSTHRTVTDTEKQTWNNKSDFNGSFNSLTDVPQASTGVAGVIQIATDNEAETGTNTTKAVNPKQLKTAIDGLGSVFTLKGSVANVGALPSTGNEIGDVYYVVSENVGYVWLNDGTTNRWEQLGLPIDLSGYVQFTDIINTLNSTASDKPLSAMQGKVLNDQLSSLATQLETANTNISTLQTKALVKPTTAPSNFELVGIDSLNSQTMVELSSRFNVEANTLNLSNGTITTLDFAESERQKSKNLFNTTKAENVGYNWNGTIASNNSPNYISCGFIKIKPNTNYIFSLADSTITMQYTGALFYTLDKTYISYIECNGNTFITPSNAEYMICQFWFESNPMNYKDIIQIEEGSVATEYQPYNGQITHNGDAPVVFAESERQKTLNLLRITQSISSETVSGVTITTDLKNQTITLNGTPTGYSEKSINISNLILKANKKYSVVAKTVSGSVSYTSGTDFYINLNNVSTWSNCFKNLPQDANFTTDTEIEKILLSYNDKVTFNNLVFQLQIQEGEPSDWQYPYGAIVHEKQIADVEHIGTIYEMKTKNTIGGTAYTAGIPFSNISISNVDFNKYKYLRFTCRWNEHGSNWFGGTITFDLDLQTPYNSDLNYISVISNRPSNCYANDSVLTFDLVGFVQVGIDKNNLVVNGYKITYTGERTSYTSDNYLPYFRIEKIEGVY